MQRVRLGKTEFQVSPIAFGTRSFGGEWGQFDKDQAKATVGRAVELGITLFDTAQGTRFAGDDWRAQSPDFTGETFHRNLAVVERLKTVAQQRGIRLAQLAVAWTLAHAAVQVTIIGARRPAHPEGMPTQEGGTR